MNPNAKSFSFNPGASTWKPPAAAKDELAPKATILPLPPDNRAPPAQPVSLPRAPVGLPPSKPVGLPSNPVSLPSKPVGLPSNPVSLPSKPVGLPSNPVSLPSKPVGLPSNPVSLPSKAAAPVLAPKVEEPAAPAPDEDEEEPIDESDPLWIATLKMCNGDREKCLKMLEDPDALMQYPEIRAVMDATAAADDDWEEAAASASPAPAAAPTSSSAPAPAPAAAASPAPKTDAPSSSSSSSSSAVDADAGPAEEDGEVKDGDEREHINLVFIGHVDAGKSTLSGSILYLMGQVDKRTIERFEKEAKARNRESWFLAFIMDTSEEERNKGITVEVGRAHFETEQHRYTILDAPGHKNYVPNMISGAAQADVGVLVISARKGEFETGFEKGGQTREHALLAKTLGVRQLVVVINKMDDPTVEWAQERYEECVSKLKPYLKMCGFTIKTEVKFLPISGILGANILEEVSPSLCPWWRPMYTSGGHNTTTPTLISTFNALNMSNRNHDGAIRIPVLDRYFERGCITMGKVESGTVRVGDELILAPSRKRTKVEAIYIKDEKVRAARTGENVSVKLTCNVEDVQKGYVLCNTGSICPSVLEFEVQLALIDMLDHRPLFSTGYDAVMHTHTAELEVTCVALVYVIDEKTQRQLKRPFARQGQQCVVRLRTPLSSCVETYDNFPTLGRVTLRDEGRTIAIGKVVKLNEVVA